LQEAPVTTVTIEEVKKMVKCELYGCGLATHAVLSIRGESVRHDIWITGNGEYRARKAAKSHEVTQKEALTVAQNARTLVIGTGCLGKVQVSPTVLSGLANKGINYIVASTPEAVVRFNNTDGPCAAIFHVHC